MNAVREICTIGQVNSNQLKSRKCLCRQTVSQCELQYQKVTRNDCYLSTTCSLDVEVASDSLGEVTELVEDSDIFIAVTKKVFL